MCEYCFLQEPSSNDTLRFRFALTKLDILDKFEEIPVAVAYKLNGQIIDYIPGKGYRLVLWRVLLPPCRFFRTSDC